MAIYFIGEGTGLSVVSYRLRVWKYQRVNKNPSIEEEQTIQKKGKGQQDKQRSTKHTDKNKDLVTRTPLTTGVNSCAPEG